MGLSNFLKSKNEKIEFVDEDLTSEEINKKMVVMSYDKARVYHENL